MLLRPANLPPELRERERELLALAERRALLDGLASCVARTVNSFRFTPGPVGGSVDFRYPFVFAPQN